MADAFIVNRINTEVTTVYTPSQGKHYQAAYALAFYQINFNSFRFDKIKYIVFLPYNGVNSGLAVWSPKYGEIYNEYNFPLSYVYYKDTNSMRITFANNDYDIHVLRVLY